MKPKKQRKEKKNKKIIIIEIDQYSIWEKKKTK